MGQMVGVTEKRSATPGVVRFELNRSLSGMGHERFTTAGQAIGPRPSASLARQLFATGKVGSVHIYGNMVTVDLAKGHDSTGLAEIVGEMYRYWKPGVEPPTFDDLQPAEESAPAAAGGGEGGDAPALTGAAARVPAHLLERSKSARARWAEKHG